MDKPPSRPFQPSTQAGGEEDSPQPNDSMQPALQASEIQMPPLDVRALNSLNDESFQASSAAALRLPSTQFIGGPGQAPLGQMNPAQLQALTNLQLPQQQQQQQIPGSPGLVASTMLNPQHPHALQNLQLQQAGYVPMQHVGAALGSEALGNLHHIHQQYQNQPALASNILYAPERSAQIPGGPGLPPQATLMTTSFHGLGAQQANAPQPQFLRQVQPWEHQFSIPQQQLIQPTAQAPLVPTFATALPPGSEVADPRELDANQQIQSQAHNSMGTGVARKAETESDSDSAEAKSSHSKPRAKAATAKSASKSRKVRKVHAADKPKRPLSAYNLFFQDQRAIMLGEAEDKSGAKGGEKQAGVSIGFAEMARSISAKWKVIDPEILADYQKRAAVEKERYKAEMKRYNRKQQDALERNREELLASVDEETKRKYFESED